MDRRNFMIKGAAALVALVAVVGVSAVTFAVNNSNPNPGDTPNNSDNAAQSQYGPGMMRHHNDGEMPCQRNKEVDREKIEEAVENGDYGVGTEATPEDHPMAENINSEEDFSKLQEAHGLMEEARSIMSELGVENGPGKRGIGMERGHAGCMR